MKNRFTAVIGLAAMLLLLAAAACADSTPTSVPTEPSVSVLATAVPTKLLQANTGINTHQLDQ